MPNEGVSAFWSGGIGGREGLELTIPLPAAPRSRGRASVGARADVRSLQVGLRRSSRIGSTVALRPVLREPEAMGRSSLEASRGAGRRCAHPAYRGTKARVCASPGAACGVARGGYMRGNRRGLQSIAVADAIPLKPGYLTEEERTAFTHHPDWGGHGSSHFGFPAPPVSSSGPTTSSKTEHRRTGRADRRGCPLEAGMFATVDASNARHARRAATAPPRPRGGSARGARGGWSREPRGGRGPRARGLRHGSP